MFGSIVAVGIFINGIQSVINIIGSISSNSIAFILPAPFYFSLVDKRHKKKTLKYYIAKGVFFLFLPFGIFAVVSQFLDF